MNGELTFQRIDELLGGELSDIKINSFGRVYFFGARIDIKGCRERITCNPGIEPRLLMELAGKEKNLMDLLKEREAILWTEGLPCELMDAAWAICAPEIVKDEVRR